MPSLRKPVVCCWFCVRLLFSLTVLWCNVQCSTTTTTTSTAEAVSSVRIESASSKRRIRKKRGTKKHKKNFEVYTTVKVYKKRGFAQHIPDNIPKLTKERHEDYERDSWTWPPPGKSKGN